MVRFPEKTKWTAAVITTSLLLFTTCNLELGDSPIGPPITRDVDYDTSFVLDVSSNRSLLKADLADTTLITALLRNSRGSAITGDTIRFTTNGIGVIIGEYAVTDSTGRARAILRSSQVNDTCIVTAQSLGTGRSDSVPIVFHGVKIRLQSDASTLKINAYATIRALLTDGSDVPISRGDSIVFSTTAGVFDNNQTTCRTQLDLSGSASIRATARSTGIVKFYATCRNLHDSISITFDSTTGPDIVSRQFHVHADKSQLKADYTDSTIITAILIDENNNPATGDTIKFRATKGIIGAWANVDSTGRARVTLRAMPVNGVSIITATSSRTKDTASTCVIFSGVTLRLESDVGDLKISENATITALLTDGSGNPIPGDTLFLTSTGGEFVNGASAFTTLLDPNGKASIKITCPSARTVWVYGSALNSADSLSIVFTNNALLLEASRSTLTVGGDDESRLTATYVDGNNNPVEGATVTFSTNAGTITTATTTTDGSGKAYSALKSANFAGTATVVASTSAGNAVVKINFVSSIANSLTLTISPDNISVNGGVASLSAKVIDANDNMVSGAEVNFRILKGPGGGEYIDKPVVATQSGIAHAQLFAGTVPSQYRGCLVMASVDSIADTAKLTISGEPYAITVARPQNDTVQVDNVGQMDESTFDYYVGAVVVDINGNPVADGTRVNFSAVVSGMAVHRLYFAGWSGLGSVDEIKPKYAWGTLDIPFEDINNNYKMDENDLHLDFDDANACRGDDRNGDGVCDFSPLQHDLWFDFNENGRVDTGMARTFTIDSTPITSSILDTICYDSIVHVLLTKIDTVKKDTSVRVCNLRQVTDTVSIDTTCYDSIVHKIRIQIDTIRKDTNVRICNVVLDIDTIGKDTICYDSICQIITDSLLPDTVWKDTQVVVCREILLTDTTVDTLCRDSIYQITRIIDGDTTWIDSAIKVCRVFINTQTRIDTLCHDSIYQIIRISTPDTLRFDTTIVVCRQMFRPDTIGWKYDTTSTFTLVGAEPSIIVDNIRIWADLYPDGVWNTSELIRDVNHNGLFDVPTSGDIRWYEYECLPYWFRQRFDFSQNDFGVSVTTSATCKNGVAYAKLTYPRQLSRRLIALVNAEANGVRDRDGERFVLPVIVGK